MDDDDDALRTRALLSVVRASLAEDPWKGAGLGEALQPSGGPNSLRARWQRSWERRFEEGSEAAPRARYLEEGGVGLAEALQPSEGPESLRARWQRSWDESAVQRRRRVPGRDDEDPWGGVGLAEALAKRRVRPAPLAAPPRRRPPARNDDAAAAAWGGSLAEILVRRDESARRRPVHRPEPRRSDYLRDDEMTYERLLALDAPVMKRPAAIPASALNVVRYRKDEFDDDACVICLENFEPGATLHQLPCQHLFHRKCVSKWLEHDARCPTCRQDIAALSTT
ncbi:hypothetical protein CTAYLR_001359 [Chrysophaeum taylorii]|uniref:RING-type E3 ubiquitin transferase n=1 Tax=Chrysophaeum taylorii TaxID=2483200 RepID=A0AAD7U574_9STRA|nr:hypothetical protein CTAYLR_001359 [Chrysophaeum taylorii]